MLPRLACSGLPGLALVGWAVGLRWLTVLAASAGWVAGLAGLLVGVACLAGFAGLVLVALLGWVG